MARHSGRVLDVSNQSISDGTKLVQWQSNGGANQLFNRVAASDGGEDPPPGYKRVWSDEFEIEGAPNPKNRSFERGFVRDHDLHWHQPDNARVQGGMLAMRDARAARAPSAAPAG